MTETPTSGLDLNAWTGRSLHRNFHRSTDQIADDLERAASLIRKLGHRERDTRPTWAASNAAEDITQQVMNLLPNLNLGLLFERARDLDLWHIDQKETP